MSNPVLSSTGFIAALCLSTAAFAAPPSIPDNSDILAEKIEDKLVDHQGDIARSAARLKRKMDKRESTGDISDDLEIVADVLEEAFSEDGIFRDFAAMLSDFAKDIDVDTEDGNTVLSFDGTEVAKFTHSKSRDSEDSVSISGLGRTFTLDRDTIVKDGKSKTRIVIDMDGENEIDITLPSLDEE